MNSAFVTSTGIFILKQAAKLPFGVLYRISDAFYVFLYYVVGYRKKVVIRNLQNAFPEKNKKEIKTISKKFFRHLADLIIETVKMAGMNEDDFRKRMIIKTSPLLDRYFDEGKSVVVLTMHYNNWEWGVCAPLWLKHTILAVYKPLNDKKFDNYLKKVRSKIGARLIPDSQLFRQLLVAAKKGEPVITWLAADQKPPVFHKFWMLFLNQETIFFTGPITVSKRFNQPVFFQKIIKTGRGRYESEFELLVENPEQKSEAEIMRAYIEKMEKTIAENPEFYLWSHRRWKHVRPADVPLIK